MIKKLTMKELNVFAAELEEVWGKNKSDIHLSANDTYSLIAIKKTLENEITKMQQTILTIGESLGGTVNPQGMLQVPNEKMDEMNNKLKDFGSVTCDIDYSPIIITKEDNFPIDLLDLFFDFVQMN